MQLIVDWPNGTRQTCPLALTSILPLVKLVIEELGLVFDIKKTGSTSVVSVNLTIRTKEKYGKNRQVDKKAYHSGNFIFSKNDQYQRDTFSSTVLVRNIQ